MTTTQRSLAPDIARGFMLLLIALAHAPLFLVETDRSVLFRPLGGTPLDETLTFLGLMLVDHRAYPLFALLLGYGMARMVGHQLDTGHSRAEALRLLRRRGWFLILFGLFNAALIHSADILGPYGLLILAVGWVTLRPDQTLWRVILVTTVIYLITVPLFALLMELVVHPLIAEGENVFAIDNYADAVVSRAFSYPIGALLSIFGYPLVLVALIGVWAARKGVLDDPGQHRQLLRRTAGLGLVISLAGALPLSAVAMQWWAPTEVAIAWLTVVHIFSGIAGGLAYAALFGLMCIGRNRPGNRLEAMLTAAGRRSLSCYLLQALLLAVVLSPALIGLGGVLHAAGAFAIGLLAWMVSVTFCWVLERMDRRGPADALLRALIHRHRARP